MGKNYQPYFSMSMAYLDIGEYATKNDIQTSEYQNAIAYQLYHALELFVKFAILLKTQKAMVRGHDLKILFEEYHKHYPSDDYQIEHPFDFTSYESSIENINETELYKQHIETFKPCIMDQHLRYPADQKNAYSIDSSYFKRTRATFLNIYAKLSVDKC